MKKIFLRVALLAIMSTLLLVWVMDSGAKERGQPREFELPPYIRAKTEAAVIKTKKEAKAIEEKKVWEVPKGKITKDIKRIGLKDKLRAKYSPEVFLEELRQSFPEIEEAGKPFLSAEEIKEWYKEKARRRKIVEAVLNFELIPPEPLAAILSVLQPEETAPPAEEAEPPCYMEFESAELENAIKNIFKEKGIDIPQGTGIPCSLGLSVTQLCLGGYDISEADAENLEYFENLVRLHVTYANLTNLDFAAQMPDLLFLRAHNNQINDISGLANLEKLREVRLEDNHISSISALTNKPDLEMIDVDNNAVTTLPEGLSGNTVMYHLGAKNNNISTVDVLANLPAISVIDLRNNNISNFIPLCQNQYIYMQDSAGVFAAGNYMTPFTVACLISLDLSGVYVDIFHE